jgi:hypothetical protein
MAGVTEWLRAAMGGGAPINDRRSLMAFIDTRAAFIAQKCVTEFCRIRSGVQWTKLFQEDQFLSALEKSRWASYGATLAEVMEMVEGVLRKHASTSAAALPAALTRVAREIVDGHIAASGAPPDFGPTAIALVETQINLARLAEPKPVRLIPEATFAVVFESLPLVNIARGHDEDYVLNNLRMNLLAVHEEFQKRGRMREICQALA